MQKNVPRFPTHPHIAPYTVRMALCCLERVLAASSDDECGHALRWLAGPAVSAEFPRVTQRSAHIYMVRHAILSSASSLPYIGTGSINHVMWLLYIYIVTYSHLTMVPADVHPSDVTDEHVDARYVDIINKSQLTRSDHILTTYCVGWSLGRSLDLVARVTTLGPGRKYIRPSVRPSVCRSLDGHWPRWKVNASLSTECANLLTVAPIVCFWVSMWSIDDSKNVNVNVNVSEIFIERFDTCAVCETRL